MFSEQLNTDTIMNFIRASYIANRLHFMLPIRLTLLFRWGHFSSEFLRNMEITSECKYSTQNQRNSDRIYYLSLSTSLLVNYCSFSVSLIIWLNWSKRTDSYDSHMNHFNLIITWKPRFSIFFAYRNILTLHCIFYKSVFQ